MNIRFLKCTSALSVALMLSQPFAALAGPNTPTQNCGRADRVNCLAVIDGKSAQRLLNDGRGAWQEIQLAQLADQNAKKKTPAQDAKKAQRQADRKAAKAAERKAQKAEKAKAQRQDDRKAARAAERKAQRAEEAKAQRQADRKAARAAERNAQRAEEAKAQRQADRKAAKAAERKAQKAEEAKTQRQTDRKADRAAERKAEEAKVTRRAQRAAERKAQQEEKAKAQRQTNRKAERKAQQAEERRAQLRAEREAEKKAERRDERQAQRLRERRRNAASAAAAADSRKFGGGRATIRRVDRNDVRRSNQDSRDWRRYNDRRRNDKKDRDHGLSSFQKFGLVTLGAVAVGAIIYESQRVVSNDGSRVVTRDPDGRYQVYRDDDVLLRRPGSTIYSEPYDDGSVRSRIVLEDGAEIFTVRDADGRVLRRSVKRPQAADVVLYDDTRVDLRPAPAPSTLPARSPITIDYDDRTSAALLDQIFATEAPYSVAGQFGLNDIRDQAAVRYLVPEISLASLAFTSGSSAVPRNDAEGLETLGYAMRNLIDQNPREVFLIEGHSDATGDAAQNLLISDERAESVALALTDEFGVPPENMVIRGYGEYDLREQTNGPSEINRRVIIRRITPLLPPPPVS